MVTTSITILAIHGHSTRILFYELCRTTNSAIAIKRIIATRVTNEDFGRIDIGKDTNTPRNSLIVKDNLIARDEGRTLLFIANDKVEGVAYIPLVAVGTTPCDNSRIAHTNNLNNQFTIFDNQVLLLSIQTFKKNVCNLAFNLTNLGNDILTSSQLLLAICHMTGQFDDRHQVLGACLCPSRSRLTFNLQYIRLDNICQSAFAIEIDCKT